MRYFVLSGKPDAEEAYIDAEWMESHREVLFPRRCKHLTPESKFQGLTVASIPAGAKLSWISPFPELKIAESNVLLDILGAQGVSAVTVIPVVARGGVNDRQYSAFIPGGSVLVRGESTSSIKGACDKCGYLYYWPHPSRNPKKWYLTRVSLKDEAPVYWGNIGELVVREDIFERVKKLNLRQIRLRELPVLDVPLDGLPADLSTSLSVERQQELGELLMRDVTDHDRQWAQQTNAEEVERCGIAAWARPKKCG